MSNVKTLITSRRIQRFQEDFIYVAGVFNVDSNGHIWKNGRRAERLLRTGYLQVRLYRNGVRYHTLSHRLVWRSFVGPIPNGLVVNHINGIKSDNRLENLEVVTYSENVKHAYRIGLTDEHGENNPAAKLTDLQVEEIRRIYSAGNVTMFELGERFGVAFQTVSKIIRGQIRSKQDGPIRTSDCRHASSERDSRTGRFVAT